jgi:hypothetical protein
MCLWRHGGQWWPARERGQITSTHGAHRRLFATPSVLLGWQSTHAPNWPQTCASTRKPRVGPHSVASDGGCRTNLGRLTFLARVDNARDVGARRSLGLWEITLATRQFYPKAPHQSLLSLRDATKPGAAIITFEQRLQFVRQPRTTCDRPRARRDSRTAASLCDRARHLVGARWLPITSR